ncbi:MAG: hypothetical protein JWN79_1534 [Gemmatimonadetes bacterium]|jgi:3-oxoacyl-[acyl-carrier-protein] synthase-3|nr:hypothetical protein [Gemmatimonadota bacterium]
MAKATIRNVALRGVVCAVPGEPIPVAETGSAFDPLDVAKIAKTVGLAHVYRVGPGQTAGDLCTAAAERLLEDLGWSRDSIDGIIMVTQNPDHFAPATACIAHGKLGLGDECLAYDVGMGCSGYVYGLWNASQAIASGTCRRVLLLAGDTSSVVASPLDRSVAMLFGDAGSATALEFEEGAEPMAFVLATDGTGVSQLMIPGGGYRHRATPELAVRVRDEEGNERSQMDLYMDGLAVFNFTLKRVPPLIRSTLAQRGWEIDDARQYLFHQANAFILQTLAKKSGIPRDRLPINIGKFGNTSMATIPLLIADAIRDEALAPEGTTAVLAGFGVGLSWAGAALTLKLRTAHVIGIPRQ